MSANVVEGRSIIGRIVRFVFQAVLSETLKQDPMKGGATDALSSRVTCEFACLECACVRTL
eukprot:3304282-Amphidinium_carterae.2